MPFLCPAPFALFPPPPSPAPPTQQATYDEAIDVWAVGVILYMLLSGEPPFPGLLDDDVFDAVLHRPPNLYEGVWTAISKEAKVCNNPAPGDLSMLAWCMAHVHCESMKPILLHKRLASPSQRNTIHTFVTVSNSCPSLPLPPRLPPNPPATGPAGADAQPRPHPAPHAPRPAASPLVGPRRRQ
jgi:serine/threonine protein kinase